MSSGFKITIKTLANQKYQLKVSPTETIAQLKGRLESELKLGAAGDSKLIYAGKILTDTQTIADTKIKPGEFLVVMISKPKGGKKKQKTQPVSTPSTGSNVPTSPQTPVTTPTPTPQTTVTPTPSTPTTTTVTQTQNTQPQTVAQTTTTTTTGSNPPKAYQEAAASLAMGSEYESTIAHLMGLGNFSHAQVVRALRAAFNNPDRAADYLFNGIPAGVAQQTGGGDVGQTPTTGQQQQSGTGQQQQSGTGQQQQSQQQTGQQQTGQQQQSGQQGQGSGTQTTPTTPTGTTGIPVGLTGLGRGLGSGGGGGDQSAAIRQMIQSNPQLLPLLLQQFASTNPQLVQALSQNPQAFQALMQSVASGGGLGGVGRGGGRGTGQGMPTGGQQVQRTSVPLTAEEKKSIDNMENLGFGRSKAIEAFLICDRNEDLAANYLFDHSGDDNGGGGGG